MFIDNSRKNNQFGMSRSQESILRDIASDFQVISSEIYKIYSKIEKDYKENKRRGSFGKDK